MESSQWENRSHLFCRKVSFLARHLLSIQRQRSRYDAELSVSVVSFMSSSMVQMRSSQLTTKTTQDNDNIKMYYISHDHMIDSSMSIHWEQFMCLSTILIIHSFVVVINGHSSLINKDFVNIKMLIQVRTVYVY